MSDQELKKLAITYGISLFDRRFDVNYRTVLANSRCTLNGDPRSERFAAQVVSYVRKLQWEESNAARSS